MPHAGKNSMRVLIVDDSEMVRNVLSAMIERLGHSALQASTAAAALDADAYDLMLLDHSLPDRPGSDVARELRARGSAVPIYGISGHVDAAERCRDAGMNGHLRKPFKLQDIATVVGVARAHTELGSAALVQVMLKGVVDELPGLVEQAAETNDVAELRRLAHTIRGTLRFIEATPARKSAARLEERAKQGVIDTEAREQLTREVDTLLPRLVELLQ